MFVRLVFVPPGGGEADYQLQFDLPAVPQKGDYISVMRAGTGDLGYETFIVRRTMWELKYPAAEGPFAAEDEHGHGSVWVECEFARGAMMCPSHERVCAAFARAGFAVPEQEETAF
jgi:hypothetical protein